MTGSISYQDWSDFLLRVGAICEPAELHGFVCGYIAARPGASGDVWVEQALEFMDLLDGQGDATTRDALVGFYDLNAASLAGGEYALQLLLPDDVLPMPTRIEGLAKWSQGLLHGLAAAGEGIAKQLDETAQDSLRDIAQIAQASSDADDEEQDEVFFVDLVEYIRLAVFNIYAQFRHVPESPPGPTTH